MSNFPIKGRANTPDEKRAILNRLLAVWCSYPDLRLGQLLDNAVMVRADTLGVGLYNLEDNDLIAAAETFANDHGRWI